MDIQSVKQRFGIIGNDPKLNLAIEKAVRIAPTDVSVLITGESGVGKEAFARIIHTLSARKHAKYIAINCGAIPEGTIDSELFGFKAGSFTHSGKEDKKGYFEEANGLRYASFGSWKMGSSSVWVILFLVKRMCVS